MKNLKRIDEAVGSIEERRVAADRLLKDVVKGSTSSVEGIKLSKEMAQAFLDWQRMSTYGKKFGKLPFYMLFTAAFNWGLDRYIGKDKKIKDEYKELKAKAKEMSKQQKMKGESVNEMSLGHAEVKKVVKDLSRNQKIALERAIKDGTIKTSEDLSNWAKSIHESLNEEETLIYDELGTELQSIEDKINDLAASAADPKWARALDSIGSQLDKLMMTINKHDRKLGAIELNESDEINEASAKNVLKDAVNALTKTFAGKKLDKSYVKDYLASMERMAKKKPMDFVKDYMNFSNDDWIEDVEYNMANEKVNEKFREGQFIKSKVDSDKFSGDVYDRTNDVDGTEIDKDMIFRVGSVGRDEAIIFGADDEIEYSIDPSDLKKYFVKESLNEARFVKSYDTKVNDAETEKEVLKIYPKAKFFVGKMSHFFGELEPNLFFKAYYPKYYKQDTGKSIKGDFKITSVYSQKGSKYVELMKESINEAKFSFSEDEVKDVAELIAKAIAKLDKTKTAVHDMDYVAGRGAGFEVSMDGEKYEGGSYVVRPNGDVVNAAIGNSFPNAIYAKIGDKDIKKVMKNIKKFESVEINEAAPKMKKSKEVGELEKLRMLVINSKKGGAGNRYGKEFDKEKNKAVVALDNMISYAKIGI